MTFLLGLPNFSAKYMEHTKIQSDTFGCMYFATLHTGTFLFEVWNAFVPYKPMNFVD